jgi:hypothetical protein
MLAKGSRREGGGCLPAEASAQAGATDQEGLSILYPPKGLMKINYFIR